MQQAAPKTFNLLSIGQRGVGKTVFLAGSYAQLQSNSLDFVESEPSDRIGKARSFWFECQDQDVQANLEKLLYHVQQTGLYPPATIKITNFNFWLKQRTRQGNKTLCSFRWSDIPGEACTLRNPEFQDIVLSSHGCCVFINAPALLTDPDYAHHLGDLFNQVFAIASVVCHHQMNYPFAIILTQCDRLTLEAVQRQLDQHLQALTLRLDAIKANYQRFYSAIPIVSINGVSTLSAKGAADPLLWLLSQLNKQYRFGIERNLADSLAHQTARRPTTVRRSLIVWAIVSLGVLGIAVITLKVLTTAPRQVPVQEQQK